MVWPVLLFTLLAAVCHLLTFTAHLTAHRIDRLVASGTWITGVCRWSHGSYRPITRWFMDSRWSNWHAPKERPEDAEEVDEARNAPDSRPEDAWPAGGRTEVTDSETDGVFCWGVRSRNATFSYCLSSVFFVFVFSSSRSCKMICNSTNWLFAKHAEVLCYQWNL